MEAVLDAGSGAGASAAGASGAGTGGSPQVSDAGVDGSEFAVIVPLSRNLAGVEVTMLDDPAEVCPPGGELVGFTTLLPLCTAPGFRHRVSFDMDRERRTPDELAAPADMCPQGWTHLGGVNSREVCGAPLGVSSVSIRAADPADTDGMICPSGTELVGYGTTDDGVNLPTCQLAEEHVAVSLTADRNGVAIADLPSPADVCPEGWTIAGLGRESTICTRPGTGSAINPLFDAQNRLWSDLAKPEDACPSGWTFLGFSLNAPVCFTTEYHAVTTIARGVNGGVFAQEATDRLLCPADFTYMGYVARAVICMR